MKILRLDLRAFGPFKDAALDLAAGNEGLHVIYGGNEAGKSSALRGLRQLFFGVDERTPDAFRHPYAQLRIGATLRHSDGSQLTFVRRKGNKNVVRAANDIEIIDPNEVQRCLGGVDEKTFRTMFGIDREALEAGGRDIIQGGGQLGHVLFAAGAGIAGLREVQRRLDEELDDLFQPRASKKRINRALAELNAAQDAVKKAALSQDEWARHDRALAEARQQRDNLAAERADASRTLNRLSRIRDALPSIARWHELRRETEASSDVPLLSLDFAEHRRQAIVSLQSAEAEIAEAEKRQSEIDSQIAELAPPAGLLENADRIQALSHSLGKYRAAMQDRPRLVAFRQQQEHEAHELLKNLGRSPNIQEAESLRPILVEGATLHALAAAEQKARTQCAGARQALSKCQGQLARTRQDLAGTAPPPDVSPLRQVIARVLRDGTLEERIASERDALLRAERQTEKDRASLKLTLASLADLDNLSVPSLETVERFEQDLAEITAEWKSHREVLEKEERNLRDLDRQIEALQLQLDVPTETDLVNARQRRDTGWKLVCQAWLEKQEHSEEERQFVSQFSPSSNVAEAYERSVGAADLISDRLRREADRVATLAKLCADQNYHQHQRDELATKLAESDKRRQETAQAWSALWQVLQVDALTPREMRAWLGRYHGLVACIRSIEAQRDQVNRLMSVMDNHRRDLADTLAALGYDPKPYAKTLAGLVEFAQEVERDITRAANEWMELENTIKRLGVEECETQVAVSAAESAFIEWRSDWKRTLQRLGLPVELSPAEVQGRAEKVHALFAKLHDADTNRRRTDGIDRDARHFQADVQALCEKIAPDLLVMDAERAVEELDVRLKRALQSAGQHAELIKQRTREADRLQEARQQRVSANAQIHAMCQDAGCSSAAELHAAEERSARRVECTKELEQTEAHLRALSAGAMVEAFIAEAAAVDADTLDDEIQRLNRQIEAMDVAIQRWGETIGGEQKVLENMSGTAAAAEAAELAECLRAQLQNDVDQFIRLHLAAAVLRRGIERYRDKQQEPVLRRASELFRELTAGSFERLQMDCRDDGEPVLKGVRHGTGELVGVEGMSDGSGDQLYLALRLASLETWLQKNEPIPFIVDDLLLNFDNERAAAALRVLGELSQHTQVLFFTHHEHLVELARQHVAAITLVVHHLDRNSA